MKLNDYLKYHRKKQKLTLVQLANKASISYGMLYRLEEGSIKQPKPHLLKQVSDALSLNYENLLIKYGYITQDLNNKKEVLIKEKDVFLLSKFINKNKKVIGTISCAWQSNGHEIVQADTDELMPICKKGDFLELKRVTKIRDNDLYLAKQVNEGVTMLIGKKRGEDIVLVNYPRTFNEANQSDLELYKLVCRYSDKTMFTKVKT